MNSQTFEITFKKVEELTPNPQNPKTHPQVQIDRIAESINQFGFTQPIVINKDNVVLVGHARLEAAKQLKIEIVPTVLKENLTEEQELILMIGDNRLSELGGVDFELLQDDFEKILKIEGITTDALGYDKDEIEAMLNISRDYSFSISDSQEASRTSEERAERAEAEEYPEDFQEVEGDKTGRSYVVHVSFPELEQAEAFLTFINARTQKFVQGKYSMIVNGDELNAM